MRPTLMALEDRRLLSTFPVTSTLDDGSVGTLRWAVGQANSTGGQTNTIVFSSLFNTPQTITLTAGQLTLTNPATTTITGPGANLLSVNGGGTGRVFEVNGGSAAVSGLTITGGRTAGNGGGLVNILGTLSLTNCTVSGNTATGNGGGLDNIECATTLTNCTVSGNSAGSGGGGLGNGSSSTATLTNCTVSGNSATRVTTSGGGGLENVSATTTLTNCTVSGNTASKGGGLDNVSGRVAVGNTIVAENVAENPPATSSGQDALGTFASEGNNLIGGTDGSSGWVSSDLTGTIAQPLNPLLAPLGNYGGPTQTMALLPGSPAIDAGNNLHAVDPTTGKPLTTDQRGEPRIVNGTVDIGAFEFSGFILVLDPSASGALSLAGNASINTPGVVYVDSSSSSALSASGNAQVKAVAIDVHGGVKQNGNASLSPTPVTGAGAPVIPNPLASLTPPSTTSMTNYGSFSLSGNSSATIQPGIYSQISVSGNAKLTMNSGIYIIEGGGFSVTGNASVTGSGVMIFNAGSAYPNTGGSYGSITLSGNGSYSLSPPATGTYAGIVFFQPLDNTQALTVTGNASGITGTIYAPAAPLSESGNGALDASLIVDTLTISGNGVGR